MTNILSENEMKKVVGVINESPGFTNYTISELKEHIEHKRLIAMRDKGNLCGIVAYRFFGRNWAEITTLVVMPEYRKQGFGIKLLQEAMKKLPGKNILAMAYNSIVKKMALRNGFRKKTLIRLPSSVWKFLLLKRCKLNKIIGFFKKKNVKFSDLEFFTKDR